jgi:hypothetical protein
MTNGTASANGGPSDTSFRHWIALGITIVGVFGVVALGWIAIQTASSPGATTSNVAREVLGTVLPVIGTWVGTVLAFYFGNENFAVASRASASLVSQLSPAQRLQSKSVSDPNVMIPLASMFYETGPAANVNLSKARNDLKAAGKGDRIPVLDANKWPLLVVHLSTIDKYMTDQALKGTQNLSALTLQDMLNDPQIAKALAASFATVKQTATLADAKAAMDAFDTCQDVFVTATGSSKEPVIGWITNTIIEDNSKV